MNLGLDIVNEAVFLVQRFDYFQTDDTYIRGRGIVFPNNTFLVQELANAFASWTVRKKT